MTISCPTCHAHLRLSEKLQSSGATAARCPKCQNQVSLAGPGVTTTAGQEPAGAGDSSIIRVSCPGCGAQLKAPASRIGSKSKCPRCSTAVTIGPAADEAARTARQGQEESSGASTRRIDSRLLGSPQAALRAGLPGAGMTDPGLFAGAAPAGSRSIAGNASGSSAASDLMGRPSEALRTAAQEIRDAAHGMAVTPAAPAAVKPAAAPTEAKAPDATARRTEPKVSIHKEQPHHPKPLRVEEEPETGPARDWPFPVWRGVVAGAISGAIVGGVLWACATGKIPVRSGPWLVSPLPVSFADIGLPDQILSFLLVLVLSIMVGLTASAVGAPTVRDRPLGFVRCAAIAALTGLALGAATTAFSGAGFTTWPPWGVLNWGRDMLVAGLLTSLLGLLFTPRLR